MRKLTLVLVLMAAGSARAADAPAPDVRGAVEKSLGFIDKAGAAWIKDKKWAVDFVIACRDKKGQPNGHGVDTLTHLILGRDQGVPFGLRPGLTERAFQARKICLLCRELS